jgi:2-dehydro-3-deoxygalactonokinase
MLTAAWRNGEKREQARGLRGRANECTAVASYFYQMTKTASRFLSCDWGTSAFRLRLVDATTCAVQAEVRGSEGIATTFAAWKAAGAEPQTRAEHYLAVVKKYTRELEEKVELPVSGLPLVVSGMASATIGWRELPYKELPFAVDGSDLRVERIQKTETFPHWIVLISGARTENDIMRGEETQLVGAVAASDSSGRR